MDWKRIGRAAMCFLVICCLLFNLSPIKAHATGLESVVTGAVVSVPGLNVVAGILIGLGILVGVATTDWDRVVNECYMYLRNEGIVDADGKINVLEMDGVAYAYGVAQDVIDLVREWAFATEAIKEVEIAMEQGMWYYNGIYAKPYPQDVDLSVYPYVTIGYFNTEGLPRCIFSSQPLLVDSKYSSYAIFWSFIAEQEVDILIYKSATDNMTGWSFLSSSENIAAGSRAFSLNAYIDGFHSVKNGMWSNYDIFGTEYFNYGECLLPGLPAITESGKSITVADGLSAGTIAGADKDLQAGYPIWGSGVVTLPGSVVGQDELDEVKVWPLALPGTYTDAYTLGQTDVWTGAGSAADTLPDTEANTGTLANTILAGIRDIFVPSSDYLTAKVDALCAEFAFADSITKTANGLIDGLRGVSTEPPVIYIDLSANRGPYDLGGEVPFLDLRWYAEYKPTVDTIISAFLWACFIWRMFLKLPGIINGAAGSFSLIRSHEQEDL